MGSFTAKIVSERGQHVYRVDGFGPDGDKRWYYVVVDRLKQERFTQALASGNLDIEEFGKILKWGQGENPPPHIKEELKKEFDLDVIA